MAGCRIMASVLYYFVMLQILMSLGFAAEKDTDYGITSQPGVYNQNTKGFCEVYRDRACSHVIGNRTVFYNSSFGMRSTERRLTAAFSNKVISSEVSEECKKYVMSFICFSVFPLCDPEIQVPVGRQICREECEEIENGLCSNEYLVFKRYHLLHHQKIFPNCEELPPVGSEESRTCMRLGVPLTVDVDIDVTCYTGRGEDYRGSISRTSSGSPCNYWNDSSIDRYYMSGGFSNSILYLEYKHSFCRNPGGELSQPWCFTDDLQTRFEQKEICKIPQFGPPCYPNPCLNGGTCKRNITNTTPVCICQDDYTGHFARRENETSQSDQTTFQSDQTTFQSDQTTFQSDQTTFQSEQTTFQSD